MNFKTCPVLCIVSAMGKERWKVLWGNLECEEDTFGGLWLYGNLFLFYLGFSGATVLKFDFVVHKCL